MISVFLTFLIVIYSYTTADSYLTHTESGTISTILNKTILDIYYQRIYFNLTFKKSYQNVPNVMLAVNSLRNCPSNREHYIRSYAGNISQTKFQFIFYSVIFIRRARDQNLLIVNSYFIVDNVKNNNIQIGQLVYRQFPTLPIVYQIAFANSWINTPQVHVSCFLVGVYCYKSPLQNFTIATKCEVSGIRKVRYQLNSNAESTTSCAIGNSLQVYAIAIRPGFFALTFGQLLTKSDYIQIDIQTTQNIYFIALVQFISPSSCINLLLNQDSFSINQISSLQQVAYEYFFLFEPYISLIISNPYDSTFVFVFLSLHQYKVTNILSSHLTTLRQQQNKIITSLTSSVTNLQQNMVFSFQNVDFSSFTMRFFFKLIFAKQIIMRTYSNILQVMVFNIDSPINQNDFSIDGSVIQIQSIDHTASETLIYLSYTKTLNSKSFGILYIQKSKQISVLIDLIIPTILQVQNSINSNILNIDIIDRNPNIIYNQIQSYNPSNIQQFNILLFSYSPTNYFTVYYQLIVVTVKSFEVIKNSDVCRIELINIRNSNIQDYSTTLTGLQIISIQNINNNTVLSIKYDETHVDNVFTLIYKSEQQHVLETRVNLLKIIQRIVNVQINIFEHWINITLENKQGLIILPDIYVKNQNNLKIVRCQFQGDFIRIQMTYNKTITDRFISISYESDRSTLYYDIVTLKLLDNQHLLYCVSPFGKLTTVYEQMSIVVVVIYWLIFVVFIFLCQKIYVVQMLFSLQFVYMSLIPIGIYCPPFNSLKFLKYSFGWNEIISSQQSNPIHIHYSYLGIQVDYFSNINFMIILLILCPIFYGVLTFLGNKSTGYRARPRLLTYGKTFLLDVPFTLILINIPNLYVSFITNLQNTGTSNILSFIFGLLSILLILTTIIIFLLMKRKFKQYQKQFCDKRQIYGITASLSTKIRRMYPLMLLMEISLISITLSLELLLDVSLYICLGILISFTLVLIIICPYISSIDNIRLFIHRFLMILLCCLLIGFNILRNDFSQMNSFVYNYPVIILIILLLIAVALHLPYLIYKSYIWILSKSLMDITLKNKSSKIFRKTYYPNKPPNPGSFYPALQFPMNPRKQQIHKNLLLIQKVNKENKIPELKWEEMILPDNFEQ